jgi:parallel beta-helix repeat protein
MTNSVARNNSVSNEDRGIVISESSGNEIYNNRVSDSGSGIDLDEDSFNNNIHNNIIMNIADPEEALGIEGDAGEQNILSSNILLNPSNGLRIDLDQIKPD